MCDPTINTVWLEARNAYEINFNARRDLDVKITGWLRHIWMQTKQPSIFTKLLQAAASGGVTKGGFHEPEDRQWKRKAVINRRKYEMFRDPGNCLKDKVASL